MPDGEDVGGFGVGVGGWGWIRVINGCGFGERAVIATGCDRCGDYSNHYGPTSSEGKKIQMTQGIAVGAGGAGAWGYRTGTHVEGEYTAAYYHHPSSNHSGRRVLASRACLPSTAYLNSSFVWFELPSHPFCAD